MTYPRSTIAHPVEFVRSSVDPSDSCDSPFDLEQLAGSPLLVRPLATHRHLWQHSGAGASTVAIADIAPLGSGHESEVYEAVNVFSPGIVNVLRLVLDNPTVFTVAGVLTNDSVLQGYPYLTLTALSDELIPVAAERSAELGWSNAPDYDAIVGHKISVLRAEKELPQAALARTLGIAQSGISEIESGRRPLDLKKLYAIAATLQVPAKELLP